MSTDKNGKAKKPIVKLTIAQFNAKKSRYVGSSVNEEIRINTGRHCVHHETVLLDADDKASNPQIGVPAMRTHHLTLNRDKKSGRVSYKTFVPIYGNWPVGKNRGEDPRGDALLDLLESLHKDYCDWLDANPTIKKKVYMASEQTCVMTAPAADHVISPVIWEKYPATHEQAGEVNLEKSPEFKVMFWDMDITPETELRPDDLLIDQRQKKGMTCVVDDREGKAIRVITEPYLQEFAYEAGDYKKGKYPFMLFQQMKLLSPTVFWESKRPAVFQIKATDMWIREKIVSDSPNAVTPEERAAMDREAEEAAQYYGIVKKTPVEQAQELHDYTRSSELDDPREAKKPRMTVEEMDFDRALAEAEMM